MNPTAWLYRNRRLLLIAGAMAVLMLLPIPPKAPAHEGHAGPMVDFVATNDALKAMLPDGARITRRKEAVNADGAAWAKSSLGVDLDGDAVQIYLLARDPASDRVVGAAMDAEFDFEHGDVRLAVGVDAAGKVTRAAVLGANENYADEIKAGLGRGFLPDLEGVQVQEITRRADAAYAAKNNAGGDLLGHLRDMAAALAALTHGMTT